MKTKKPKSLDIPKRRRPDPEIETETLDIEDAPANDLPDMKDLEADEKLAIFHNKFGGEDYKIRVEKFNKEENEWGMVGNLKLAGFDSFDSLKKYGAGQYRMSLLDNGGQYVAGGRMTARLDVAAIEAAKEEVKAAPDAGMSLIVTMLQAQNAQNVELMKAMLGRPVPAESKAPSITELIAGMAGIRNLMPKEESGMGGIRGTLELMKLVKELTPAPAESGGDDTLMGEVEKAISIFGKVQPMIAARRAAPGVRPPAPALPNPPAPAPAPEVAADAPLPEPTEPDPMKPVIEKALSYVPQLVAWANRGKDLDEVADFVVDELENEIVPLVVKFYRPGGMVLSKEFVWDNLLKKASDPAEVAAIFAAVPALAPHKEWFERVVAKAYEFATEPHDDGVTANPEPGNVA